MAEIERCEACGAPINPERTRWLHLNCATGRYSTDEVIPEAEDQGWFQFGPACAKRVLANGGNVPVELRRRRDMRQIRGWRL